MSTDPMSTEPLSTGPLDIGQVTAASGLPASTLHVWENKGLLHPVGRASARRQYDPSVLARIAIIVTMQRSGFTLEEIRDLLDPAAFTNGKEALQQKLDDLVNQREELDRAIEGIGHAIACQAPSPLECDGFRHHLDGVLPVKQRSIRPRPGVA